MEKHEICVGVVGAGAISDIYFQNMIHRFDNLRVKAVCAGHLESAQRKAEQYGIIATTLEEMLADPEIELMVNLTPAHAHYGITGTFHINADSVFADQAFFYIYGTKGILVLPDPNQFAGPVRMIPQTEEFWKQADPVTLWAPEEGEVNLRGIGPSEMADTILHGTRFRPTGRLACHVHEYGLLYFLGI